MKKAYVKPSMESEAFVPNTYVAACGDTEYGYYLFECNAGIKGHEYAIKNAAGRPVTLGGMYMDGRNYYFHPCGETHRAPTNGEFITGYHIDDMSTRYDDNIQVTVWVESSGWGPWAEHDVHCTTKLNQESWETAKS